MIDYLRDLIGLAPLGFEFVEYFFSFILVLSGLFIIYKAVEALCRMF